MKKTDYRIKELNGKFIIEVKVPTFLSIFLKGKYYEWERATENGLARGHYTFLPYDFSDYSPDFLSLKDAFTQIENWCEVPKYHYFENAEEFIEQENVKFLIERINAKQRELHHKGKYVTSVELSYNNYNLLKKHKVKIEGLEIINGGKYQLELFNFY